MALSNTGITTSLVGNALGTSSRSVGALCSSSLINPFSRFKPVKWYQRDTTEGIANREKGDSGTYGISVRTCSLASPTDLANSTYAWFYDKPSGGRDYPYRLGDFRGYEHNAQLPFSTSLPNKMTFSSTAVNEIPKVTVANGGSNNLGLNDILNESNIYAGVKVQAADGSYYWYSSLAVGARPLQIDFNVPPFFNNNKFLSNIDVSLFLCNYYQVGWSNTYPSSGFKCWQPIITISKHYDVIEGTRPSLPSSNLIMSSITPTKVTWANSNNVSVVLYVTSFDETPPSSSLKLKISSYLGYTSSIDYTHSTNPTTQYQFKWVSDGNGVYHTTPLLVTNTLILNSAGNPQVGTNNRSATIQFYEKIVLSTITYYSTIRGIDTKSISLTTT